jgi:hypothetical protein
VFLFNCEKTQLPLGPPVGATQWVRSNRPVRSGSTSPTLLSLTRSRVRTLTLTRSGDPRRLRRRRLIPASSAGLGPRHGAQSTRPTTAVNPIRVDLTRASSCSRPRPPLVLGLRDPFDPAVPGAPGAWTSPWLRRRGAGVTTVPPWPGLVWRRCAPACAAVAAMAAPVYSSTVSAPPLFFSLLCFFSSFS